MQTTVGQVSIDKKKTEYEKSFQAVLDKTVDGKKVFGTSFAIKKDTLTWHGASGNISIDQPYFIASTTKLFTTSIILKLRTNAKLSLDDRISSYIDQSILSGLHIYKGKDYSEELTIKQLLSHTSGLPDYFQGKGTSGKSLENEITAGNDQFWTFEQAIERTKKMKPLFAPGTKNKASYSDANFQLLGKIIEAITHKSYPENCKEYITQPLGLTKTYLFQDITDKTPKTLYYKSNELNIPKAMTSFGADGGIVSTSADMLVFIEAFFTGKLFPSSYIDELQVWNKIFFPMSSGVGFHLFKLPWLLNPTGAVPYFIGHSGLSGALAYYSPKENIFIVGTVNQVAHPDISFKTMIKLTQIPDLKGDPNVELIKLDRNSNDIIVRRANNSDVGEITQLFYDTIQNVNIRDYSQEEVDDWSSWKEDNDKWLEKMQEQYFVVAEINNKIAGFGSLALDGYLDFMFVHKDTQGQGVASALLSEIERKAMEQNNDLIYSDVSITAKAFFESKGFVVERQQLKKSRQKELINFRMNKKIMQTPSLLASVKLTPVVDVASWRVAD